MKKARILIPALLIAFAFGGTAFAEESTAQKAKEAVKEAVSNAEEYLDDAEITTAVKGKFIAEKGLDSLDISVKTNDGIVTLTGEVDNAAQISLAENLAKNVKGVKSVTNKLTTK